MQGSLSCTCWLQPHTACVLTVQGTHTLRLAVKMVRRLCAGANIASDAESIRLNLRDLAAEQLPPELQAAGRTEVLPVQWRKHLSFTVRAVAQAPIDEGGSCLCPLFIWLLQ